MGSLVGLVCRMRAGPPKTKKLPLPQHLSFLRNLLFSVCAIKRLGGSAILEPRRENNTYSEEQLPLKILTGKVALTGCFLRVARALEVSVYPGGARLFGLST